MASPIEKQDAGNFEEFNDECGPQCTSDDGDESTDFCEIMQDVRVISRIFENYEAELRDIQNDMEQDVKRLDDFTAGENQRADELNQKKIFLEEQVKSFVSQIHSIFLSEDDE